MVVDASAMQSGSAVTDSGEYAHDCECGDIDSSSSLMIGMMSFGIGAVSALALLKVKQKLEKRAVDKPAGPGGAVHLPDVSVSTVTSTMTTDGVNVEMEIV